MGHSHVRMHIRQLDKGPTENNQQMEKVPLENNQKVNNKNSMVADHIITLSNVSLDALHLALVKTCNHILMTA